MMTRGLWTRLQPVQKLSTLELRSQKRAKEWDLKAEGQVVPLSRPLELFLGV